MVVAKMVSSGVLGSATEGSVHVAAGATLYADSTGISTTDSAGVKRPIYISGEGAEGMPGAYTINCVGGSGNYVRSILPNKLILEDDAVFGCVGSSYFVYDGSKTIDAQSYKLVFRSDCSSSTLPRFYVGDLYIKNPVSVTMDGVHLRMRMSATNRDAKIDGGAEVVITLINGADLQYEDNNAGFRWTLVFDETAGGNVRTEGDSFTADRQSRVWAGPVVLNRQITIHDHTKDTDAARAGSYSFGSTISGPGGISMAMSAAALAQNRTLTLFLGGDVTASSLSLTNVNLYSYAMSDIELPAQTTFDGDIAVDSDGIGKFSAHNVTKTGEGTLNIACAMTGETLDVRGGKISLPQIHGDEFRRKAAGLHAGRLPWLRLGSDSGYLPFNKTDQEWTDTDGTVKTYSYTGFVTNEVVRIPPIFTETENDSKWFIGYIQHKDYAYQTYDGFIWNDSEEPATWTFINVLAAQWEMTIGETKLVNNTLQAANQGNPTEPVIANVVLQPGANAFRMRFGFQFSSSGNAGCVATNGLSGAWNGMGVAYDTQARQSKDAADYTTFSADETVPLFTTAPVPNNDFAFDSVIGIAGTQLDLNGIDRTFGSVAGAISIVNGAVNLKVTGQDAAVSAGSGKYVLPKISDGREKVAGLWYGETGDCGIYENVLTKPEYMYIMSNSVDTALAPFFHETVWPGEGDDWSTFVDPFWSKDVRRYKTWSGYIYNDEPTQTVWTVIDTMNAYAEMKINGEGWQHYSIADGRWYGGNNGTAPYNVSGKMVSITLNPGYNLFQLRYYNRWNSANCWPGSVATMVNGQYLVNWKEGNGLMFDRLGRNSLDLADYEPMADSGDGRLFTYEAIEPTTIASVTTQPGAVIDLQGETRYIETLSGPAQIENGKLVVKKQWTMTAAQILAEGSASCGVEMSDGAVFSISKEEAALLKGKHPAEGFLIATDWAGGVPATEPELGEAGWTLTAVNGELRLCRKSFVLIIR
ncbi:MAG: hypothetical protein ACI4RD_05970 [Kiritimatiellia bacterium]